MKPLSKDFEFHKYGIDVRLAEVEDSAFILKLRTSKRGQILKVTDNDLDKQVEWMKEYKVRERNGLDYYFIYSFNGVPFGVNRINDIDYENKTCSSGSWVCSEDTPFERAISTCLIVREIEFDLLGVDYCYGLTKKVNKQIQKFSKLLGSEVTGESDTEIYYRISREQYQYGNNNVKKILCLKD